MLEQHLSAKTRPLANPANVVFWNNYRIRTRLSRRSPRVISNLRKNALVAPFCIWKLVEQISRLYGKRVFEIIATVRGSKYPLNGCDGGFGIGRNVIPIWQRRWG